MRALALLASLAACSSSSSSDITGPFTGPVHRFVVDRISVPSTTDASAAVANDLDGNGTPENKLGLVTAVLATTNDLSLDGPDMIAAGSIDSVVLVQADDLVDDPSVGVRYFGLAADADAATDDDAGDDAATVVAGGALASGTFHSNRAATTRHPGRAIVVLPIFTNADPLALPLEGVEIDLVADAATPGGFTATIRGGIRQEHARTLAYAGLVQMFEHEPDRHLVFQRQIDRDRDGTMSRAELDDSIIATLVTADIQLFDGTRYTPKPEPTARDSLSIAFSVHLVPCPAGRCANATTPVADHCRDRIRDGNESDVDCGGSCRPCFDGRACAAPGDCQSNACTANRCVAATCSDGVLDGFESDVDCGGACAPCAQGRICAADSDCTSNGCNNGPALTGICQ